MKTTPILAVAIALVVGAVPATGQTPGGPTKYRRPGSTTRLLEGHAHRASVSGDGRYVVFESQQALAQEDESAFRDVFVLDRKTGQIELISSTHDGAPVDGDSQAPQIGADGRHVVFSSEASNLVPGDTNAHRDVFLHDRVTGATRLLSVTPDGTPGDGDSFDPVVTPDARFAAFASQASNLVAGDRNGSEDTFLRDLTAGVTERVSVDSEGREAEPDRFGQTTIPPNSWSPRISDDGRFVAFMSQATLAGPAYQGPTKNPYGPRAYVRDRVQGSTELVSIGLDGNPASLGLPPEIAFSANGRYVFYESHGQAVPYQHGQSNNIFMYDRVSRRVDRVSIASDTTDTENNVLSDPNATDGWVRLVGVSGDGRLVAFTSSQALGHSAYRYGNLFVRNTVTGETQLVAERSGSLGDAFFLPSPFTADGRELVFAVAQALPEGAGQGLFVHALGGQLEVMPGVSVSRGAEAVEVEGAAAFWGQTVARRTDPLGDTPLGNAPDVGRAADLVEARAIVRPEQADLFVRLDVDRLWPARRLPGYAQCVVCPPPHNAAKPFSVTHPAGLPGITYLADLRVGVVTYRLRAESPDRLELSRCEAVCLPVGSLPGGIGTTGQAVTFSVPLSLLEIAEGTEVSSIRVATALAGIDQGQGELDGITLPAFRWPGAARVEVELREDGSPAGPVTKAGTTQGRFSMSIPAGPGQGSQVALRGCLGDVCGPEVLVTPG